MLTRRNWVKTTAATLTSTVLGAQWVSASVAQAPAVRTLHIKNLHCEGCAKRLHASIFKVEGVQVLQTYVEAGTAVITPTQAGTPSAKALWQAAVTQKFEVAKLVTPAGTFEEMPQS